MNDLPLLAYEEVSVEPWTSCVKDVEGRSIWITGTCSRCAHRTRRRFGRVVASGASAAPTLTQVDQVLCDCNRPHKDRPPGGAATGCGAIWWGSSGDA